MDKIFHAKSYIDTGCASYGMMSWKFARQLNLQRIPIKPRVVNGFNGSVETVSDICHVHLDVRGYIEHHPFLFLFMVQGLRGYDFILGRPWLNDQGVVIAKASLGKKTSNLILGQSINVTTSCL